MSKLSLEELVEDLRQSRMNGRRPALFLGAGASVGAGIGTMADLYHFIGCADFEQFSALVEGWPASERYGLLFEFLQTREPAAVTAGYQALAALCEHYYFDLVLTTNLDPLVDDALAAARLQRKDYIVLVNGVIETEWLAELAHAPSPRVKVIKLHGDLFFRRMAWTVEEMNEMVGAVHEQLVAALENHDLLVVGDSLRDEDICELVERLLSGGQTVWFVNPQGAPARLAGREGFKSIVGSECKFEPLFEKLAAELIRGPSDGEGPTLDDLMASVVGLAPKAGDFAYLTGFVLAEPRVVVTDGFADNIQQLDPKRVTLVSSDLREHRSRFLRRDDSHPFGPLLLEAPADLKVPGLRLDTSSMPQDLGVYVAVAAGGRRGLSSGPIADTHKQARQIYPLGSVDDTVAIDCVVARGSSGAPVVDGSMAVRGFVIAGAEEQPPTLMYPAECWAPFVESA